MSKYSIILADPPWWYNKRNNPTSTKFGKGASGHYPCMKTEEICNLPIGRICKDNCALFLWSTGPRQPDAHKVIEAWGFDYKTIGFTWVKVNKNGSPWFGPGYYTAGNIELCLLAVKGRMKPVSNYVSQIIMEQRRKHSMKPDSAKERIVELFGDIPRVELFARETNEGWDALGNEIDGQDIRIVLNGTS